MAEPEPEQTPASSRNVSAEPEYGSQVEPVPEWSTARAQWGVAWEVHLYGLGVMFALIAIQGMFSIFKLRHLQNSRHKKVHIINFSLLSVFGLSRALFLVIDGYHSKRLLPVVVVKILWGIGQPCIITAYILMFVVLKNALVMRQRFRSWYTTRNIALATLPYFMFVCVAEMTVAFIPSFIAFTFVCQILYVSFTVLLLLFYTFIARLLWKKKRSVKSGQDGFGVKERGSRLQSILVVCFMAIFGGLSLLVSRLYATIGVYGVFSDARVVPPWPWYVFNTVQRLLELYMSVLLVWILSYKTNVSSNENHRNTSTTHGRALEHSSVIVVKRHINKDIRVEESTNELNLPGCLTLESA
jgi:hypothetical protein